MVLNCVSLHLQTENHGAEKGMVKFTGINHLAMATNDMDSTIRFWRDLLGMRLVAGLGRPGYRHYFFEISDNDMIAFFEWPDVKKIELKDHGAKVKGPLAFDHVAFGVETDDALWKLKADLEAAGFWVSEVIDHGFIHSIYSFDPNNIPIEFSASVAEADVRKRPGMVDSAPSAVAQEGPDPQPGRWPEPNAVTPGNDRRIYPGDGMALHRPEKED